MTGSANGLGLEPVVAVPLGDRVTSMLRQSIVTGAIRAGTYLREVDLAASMGVSRGPVREALARLEHEGLVVIRRNRGAQVIDWTATDIAEVYTLRLALERLACSRAAERVTDQHRESFDVVLESMRNLRSDYTAQEAAELDLRFHDIIYEAADHRRLQAAWGQLRSQVYAFLASRNYSRRDFYEIAYSEHLEIRNLLVDHNGSEAVACIERHIKGAFDRISLSIPGMGQVENPPE